MLTFYNKEASKYFSNDDYLEDVLEKAEELGYTVGYYNDDNEEEHLIINDDYIYLDYMGAVQKAKGKYAQFLRPNVHVTKLENMMNEDIDDVRNGNLDIVCSSDIKMKKFW